MPNLKKISLWLLILINFLLYGLVIGIWVILDEEYTLKVSVSLLSISLTGILLWIVRKRWESFYESRFFKKSVAVSLSVFLLVSIMGMVNFLAYKNPYVVDFSTDQIATLTDTSKNLVRSLDQKIHIRIFTRQQHKESIIYLVDLFRYEMKSLTYEVIDADLNPEKVKAYGVYNIPTLIVESADKKVPVDEISELGISNAFIKLKRSKDVYIWTVSGHDEIDFGRSDKEGAVYLSQLIKKLGYKIESKNLLLEEAIPEDLSALLIMGPRKDFDSKEMVLVQDYIKNGGKLLIALDPDFNNERNPKLVELLASKGIQINNDLVIDRIDHVSGSSGSVPLIKKFNPRHSITKQFQGEIFFPLSSSIQLEKVEGGVTHELAFSNAYPAAWAHQDKEEIKTGKLVYQEGRDVPGPISVVATYEEVKEVGRRARIVAFGNSSFIINAYGNFGNNYKFFLNSLNWLVNDDLISSLNVATREVKPLFISNIKLNTVFYFSILFVPLVLLMTAGIIYFRKKRL